MTRPTTTTTEYDFIFKLVLIGDSGVGKSNLLLRFTRNEFNLNNQPTIGVEFAQKQVVIDGKKIKTQVWDTAGQERFKTVIPQFYRGSEGALIVFDLTYPDSLDHVPSWIEEVYHHVSPDLPIILIGNKCDLTDKRQVSRQQATSLAERYNIAYMETSALNASNVEQAFNLLITNIYRKKSPKQIASSSSAVASIDFTHTRTISIGSSATQAPEKPIKISQNHKKPSATKEGCCVIS